MEKAFITGGAGFIGSHIAEACSNPVIFDNLSTGKRTNVPRNAKFVKGDIRNLGRLTSAMKGSSSVFHLAALVSVPKSMQNPKLCFDINTTGTLNALEAARKNDVDSFVFSSSAAVYGNNPKMPKKEYMIQEPISPYGISKLDGERLCQMYFENYGLKTISLRYFNIFGPRQDPNSPYSGVISVFMNNASKNKAISIFGDGKQSRDFVYVKDVVSANLLAAKKLKSGIYNVGLGRSINLNQLANTIMRITGSRSKVTYGKPRKGDIRHSLSDPSKLKKLGWKPRFSLEQGLRKTVGR